MVGRIDSGGNMDLEQSRQLEMQAVYAAIVSMVITSGLTLVAISQNGEGALAPYDEPLNFIDVGFMGILAYFVYRHARTAAVLLFFFFLFSQILNIVTTGNAGGTFVALVFLYFFFGGIRGTFAYHRLKREEDPSYRGAKVWQPIVGLPVLAVFFGLLGLGVSSQLGFTPPAGPVSEEGIAENHRTFLIERGYLAEDETIQLFYTTSLLSMEDSGNLISDRRILVWSKLDEDTIEVFQVPLAELESVTKLTQNSDILDAAYLIRGKDGTSFMFEIAPGESGEDTFRSILQDFIRDQSRNRSPLISSLPKATEKFIRLLSESELFDVPFLPAR